jgi:hypothetical protein
MKFFKKLKKILGLESIKKLEALNAWIIQNKRYEKFANTNYGLHPSYPLKNFSQNDEDGYIDFYNSYFSVDSSNYFLEIGIGDGTQNNTINLLLQGWSGVWIDAFVFRKPTFSSKIEYIQKIVDEQNILEILGSSEIYNAHQSDKFGFLSIDIDGKDYLVLETILKSFRPKLICCEINGQFGPRINWKYTGKSINPDRLTSNFGMSFKASCDLLKEHQYTPLAINAGTGLNMFAIRNDLIKNKKDWNFNFIPPLYTSYDYLFPKRYPFFMGVK